MIECNAKVSGRFLNRWMSLLPRTGGLRKVALLALAVVGTAAADAKVIYVNGGVATSGDGTTWAKSFIYLQEALAVAAAGDSVFLAKGVYYPDDGVLNGFGDREISFVLNSLTIYGGFVGNETSINQRDPVLNPTVLSGEIWDVTPTTPGYDRYWSLHVVVLQGSSTLDGLIIEKGRANGDEAPFSQGGGVLAPAGTILTLNNCTLRGNLANQSGGAVWGTVVATDCVFSDNVVNNEQLLSSSPTRLNQWLFNPDCEGGAINGNVTATRCKFLRNSVTVVSLDLGNTSSASGGAIAGNVTAVACMFDGNTTSSESYPLPTTLSGSTTRSKGGAISGTTTATNCSFVNNESVSLADSDVSPDPKKPVPYIANASSAGAAIAGQVTITNCSFSKNDVSAAATRGDLQIVTASGGALYVEGTSSVVNSNFVENSAFQGGAIYTVNSSVLPIMDSTFMDNLTFGVGAAISCGGSVNILSNIFWFNDPAITLTGYVKNKLIHVSGTSRISNRLYPTPSTETLNLVKGALSGVTRSLGANVDLGDPPERSLINKDPLFVNAADAIGPDGLWATADDGLRLTALSPVIGVGKPIFLPKDTQDLDDDGNLAELVPTDVAGFSRIQDGTLDLGAYEFGDIVFAPDISVERPVGTILVDGASTIDFSTFPRVATTFVIRNTGSSDLSKLVITGTGADITSFNFNQPAANLVVPGGSTTFAVTFVPTAAGPRTARLIIASNDPNENPFEIDLFGSAPVPDIAVEYPAGTDLVDDVSLINYGAVGSNSSASRTFTIRNSGLANLSLLGISSFGANSGNFTVSAPGQTVLVPGATTTFNVVFRPSGTGNRNASIIIQSSDPDAESSFLFNVTGSGFNSPEIFVSEPFGREIANGAKSDFGSVGVSLLHSKTFVVKNTGTATLKNIAVTLSGASQFTKTKIGVTSLAPGAEAKFSVTFKPTATGKKTATLLIKSNDSDESSISIALSGTGVSKSSARAASAPLAESPVGSTPKRGVVTMTRDSDGLKHLVLTVDKSLTRRRTVEVSSNLTEWFSGPDFTTTLLDNNSILRVRDRTPIKPGGKRYIRLK
jgi:predicted outer membrane repeat protein